MRFLVLGATGKTGRAVVGQALTHGHTITTFGRSPFSGEATGACNVIGNPTRVDDLALALSGHDAVLSALGTRGLGATSLLADSARATIEAMHRAMVRRLVIISSSLAEPGSGWLPRLVARTLLRHTACDQRAMEALVTSSGLDWTVLRPARLGDGAMTGRYAVSSASAGVPVSSAAMSRQDVAHMMLDTVERGAHIREIVSLRGSRA